MQIPESLMIEKQSADKIWDFIYCQYRDGKSSKDEIAWALNRCNNVDYLIFKHQMERYYERRNAERDAEND